MGVGAFASSAAYIAAVLALGLFLWRVFSRMHADLVVRFDKVDERLDRVETGLGKVERRVGSLEVRMESVEGKIVLLEGRVSSLEVRMDSLDGRMGSVEKRLGTLDHKVDRLADDHQTLGRELSEFRGEMRGHFGGAFSSPAPA